MTVHRSRNTRRRQSSSIVRFRPCSFFTCPASIPPLNADPRESPHAIIPLPAAPLGRRTPATACESPLPPPPTSFDDRFRSADADKDGLVSHDELADYMAYHLFYKRDANRDGELTLQEWWPGADKNERVGFDKRDDNENGIVTLKEARLYARADPAIDSNT